jgi:hypothetical protein
VAYRTDAARVRSRVGDLPAVRVASSARSAPQDQLARGEQRDPGPAVGPVRDAGRSTEPLGCQPLDDPLLVCERRHRRQQQPRRALGPAKAEDALKQPCVDLALPPRPRLSDDEPQRARPSAPGRRFLNDDEAPPDEHAARLQEPARLQPRSARRRRRARPRTTITVGEARERERHQSLAGRELTSSKYRGDRAMAHRRASVRGTDAKLSVLARPAACPAKTLRGRRIGHKSSQWVMRLKAIASSRGRHGSSR